MFKSIFLKIKNRRSLLLGILYIAWVPIFAVSYYFVEGFKIQDKITQLGLIDSIYFSVITLTTLGYGDITPVDAGAKALAALQAIFGVGTIGMFLFFLADERTVELSNDEKKRDDERRKLDAKASIKKQNLLLQPLIDNYILACKRISTSSRSQIGDFNSNFPISVFTEIFDPSLLMRRALHKPKIIFFYEAQNELKVEIERLLLSADLSYWPDLLNQCVSWVHYFQLYNYSDALLNKQVRITGGGTRFDFDKQLLENFSDTIRINGNSAIDDYFALYLQLQKHVPITQQIQTILHKITDNETPSSTSPK